MVIWETKELIYQIILTEFSYAIIIPGRFNIYFNFNNLISTLLFFFHTTIKEIIICVKRNILLSKDLSWEGKKTKDLESAPKFTWKKNTSFFAKMLQFGNYGRYDYFGLVRFQKQ